MFNDITLKTSLSPKYFSYDPIVTSDTPFYIIAFNRAGNLILIKTKADSIKGNFILYTGAPGLILNITYFRNYLKTEETRGEAGVLLAALQLQAPQV